MTQSKHTPGPWSVFYKQKYGEWHVAVPIAHGGIKLALFPNGIQTENQESDARLIAAAPELFSVLKMVQEAAIDMRGEDFNLTTEQWAVFHSAIAKATGTTQ